MDRSTGLLAHIEDLTAAPTSEKIERFGRMIREFRPWGMTHAQWPARFMQDCELNRLTGRTAVDDL